jgi:Uncharacterized protein conserved in bacteria
MRRRAVPSGKVLLPRPGNRPVAIKGAGAVAGDAVLVPDLIGLGWNEAWTVLRGLGLGADSPDPDWKPLGQRGWQGGVVVDQRPRHGTRVPPGSRVTLWIERGPGSAGMREPRRPNPAPRTASGMVDEQTDEAIG